jgi:hypothetical protein
VAARRGRIAYGVLRLAEVVEGRWLCCFFAAFSLILLLCLLPCAYAGLFLLAVCCFLPLLGGTALTTLYDLCGQALLVVLLLPSAYAGLLLLLLLLGGPTALTTLYDLCGQELVALLLEGYRTHHFVQSLRYKSKPNVHYID